MSSNISPELQKQIEQEAKAEAKKLTGRVPIFRMGYESGYYDGAEKYADLWQAAEARADRYEKALKELRKSMPDRSVFANLIDNALTPKTSTDANIKTD